MFNKISTFFFVEACDNPRFRTAQSSENTKMSTIFSPNSHPMELWWLLGMEYASTNVYSLVMDFVLWDADIPR